MSAAAIRRLVALLAVGGVAAGVALLVQAQAREAESPGARAPEPGSGVPRQDPTATPASGQDPAATQEQQEGDLQLAERESIGQDGQRMRVGNSEFLATDIFDFSGVANDLFFWAWLPTVSGQVADNAFLGGQTIDITDNAAIGGDAFVAAQTLHLDGRIGGDLYAFANDIRISASAVVEGALYGGSAAASIDGTIGGPLNMATGEMRINGTIRGDVSIECGELELGPNAVIEGELRYESAREARIDPGARVVGQIRHFIPREDDPDEESAAGSTPERSRSWLPQVSIWSILWNGWWWLSSFLVGALALALGGEAARRPAARLVEQPALGLGFGFVVAVVFPAAAILSMILLVTIPLGLIGLSVYFAALYVARLVAAQAVGDWVLRALRGGADSSAYVSLAVGLFLFAVLTEIPYVGFLIWVAALIGGLGGLFLATRRARPAVPPPPAAQPVAAP